MKNIVTKTLIIVFLLAVCLASADKALAQADSLDADGYIKLGNAHAEAGRWQEAIEAYKQAIKLKPDDAWAYLFLGDAYGESSRWKEAIEAYKQVIKLNDIASSTGYGPGSPGGPPKPDLAEAHNNLGLAYANLGRWQEAIEAYKQAITLNPDYAEAHYNLGLAYVIGVGVGDKGSALEEYKILKTLNPEMANKLFNEIYK